MSVLFEAKVAEIGEMVAHLAEEKMMILFNQSAPKELRDVSVIHVDHKNSGTVQVGDTLKFDDQSYRIVFVGDKANDTLQELGHVTLKFNGEKQDLPGSICLEDKPFPTLSPETVIQVVRG